MKSVALIGGTGAEQIIPADAVSANSVSTPFGEPSSAILAWRSANTQFSFIARHGRDGTIPPHRVNYRANMWAIRETAPDHVIGLNTVGGIDNEARPTRLVFPDQLVDYTWGRDHTYADGIDGPREHIDFTVPVSGPLRRTLIDHARNLALDYMSRATCAVTQGPRLETAAEIDRLERDGCHIVGMTAMPEAALARELDLDYVICAVVVNWAAGRGQPGEAIHSEIHRHLAQGMGQVGRLLSVV